MNVLDLSTRESRALLTGPFCAPYYFEDSEYFDAKFESFNPDGSINWIWRWEGGPESADIDHRTKKQAVTLLWEASFEDGDPREEFNPTHEAEIPYSLPIAFSQVVVDADAPFVASGRIVLPSYCRELTGYPLFGVPVDLAIDMAYGRIPDFVDREYRDWPHQALFFEWGISEKEFVTDLEGLTHYHFFAKATGDTTLPDSDDPWYEHYYSYTITFFDKDGWVIKQKTVPYWNGFAFSDESVIGEIQLSRPVVSFMVTYPGTPGG